MFRSLSMPRHLVLPCAVAALACAVAGPIAAQRGAVEVEALAEALALDEVIAVMREEGIEYGAEMQRDLFPGRGGDGWARTVAEIYDADAMERAVVDRLAGGLDESDIIPLTAFFTSSEGERIVRLELEARRALMDEDVEDAARARAASLRTEGAPLIGRIDAFIAANDLVEQNVVGAMNANYAFYEGMAAAQPLELQVPQDQILSDVWSQEPEIRQETAEWIDAFLTMAYAPLPDGDLDTYTALSQTEAGRALNTALFAAFDEMYAGISRRLGAGAALYMSGQDI